MVCRGEIVKKLALLLLWAVAAWGQPSGGIPPSPQKVLFANLGTPLAGNWRYCTNCAATAPCTGSGSGAFAYRVGSVWNCNDGSSSGGGGSGTVTSVAATVPSILSLSGSPITTSGTLAISLASQSQNRVFASPNGSSGTPTFRALVAADVPTLNQDTTGNAATATDATNATKVLLADDNSLSADVFPTWVATTSANVAEKTSSLKLTFNPLTGALAATSFTGALSGNAATATALAANPSDCSANQYATTIAASGNLTCSQVTGSQLSLSDVTTNDSTTSLHGFLPKLGGGTTNFLRADGTWAAPSGGVTNSAGNNVVPKSNGTNIVASSISDDGTTVSTAEVIKSSASLVSGAHVIVGGSGVTSSDVGWTLGNTNYLYAATGNFVLGSAGTVLNIAGANILATGNVQFSTTTGPMVGPSINDTGIASKLNGFPNYATVSGSQLMVYGASNNTKDTSVERVAGGVVGAGVGTAGTANGWFVDSRTSRVSTQFDSTLSTTLANVTGLSVSVLAGRTYSFDATLYTSSNVAGGIQAAIAGTATATAVIYEGYNINGATLNGQTRATSLGTAVAATTAVTSAMVKIFGTITVNAAGTLTVQFAQNTTSASASSVLVGSVFIVTPH